MKGSPHTTPLGRFLPGTALGLCCFVAASSALAQCSMCSGAADASSGEFAYSKSTLFMLSVPYLLLGAVAGYVVHAFRRGRGGSRGEQKEADPADR